MKNATKKNPQTSWVLASHRAEVSFHSDAPKRVQWGIHATALGRLIIGVDDRGALCLIAFADGRNKGLGKSAIIAKWKKKWPKTEFAEDAAATAMMRDSIFAHNKPIKVHMVGTRFQQAVWKVIAAIPAGETITYADLARKIKNPKAVRAAGTACGANPVAVVVPCHRVVATGGGLGGFGGGLPLKRQMLAAESA